MEEYLRDWMCLYAWLTVSNRGAENEQDRRFVHPTSRYKGFVCCRDLSKTTSEVAFASERKRSSFVKQLPSRAVYTVFAKRKGKY